MRNAADIYNDWQSVGLDASACIHIAIMHEPFLSYIFDGKKTVESRFSLHKIAPYQMVQPGDLVFMKAGPVVGCFTADWVRCFDLAKNNIEQIRAKYDNAICGDKTFWRQKATKRYVTLIGIRNLRQLKPIKVSKFDRRAWVSIRWRGL